MESYYVSHPVLGAGDSAASAAKALPTEDLETDQKHCILAAVIEDRKPTDLGGRGPVGERRMSLQQR